MDNQDMKIETTETQRESVIPKNVFDKEYSTQWRREVQFLENKGINYTYAKKHFKYPIIRYKYTKTPELFLALAEFYNQVRNEKFFKDVEKTSDVINKALPIEEGCINMNASELSDAEKKLMNFQNIEDEVVNLIKEDEFQKNNVNDDTE